MKIPAVNFDQSENTNSFLKLDINFSNSIRAEFFTDPVQSNNPSWYACFIQKMKIPQSISFEDLENQLGYLKFGLFDYKPQLNAGDDLNYKITYYLEKRFLGELHINIFDIL